MGKGSGGGGQTTSTTNTSNVPEYARPYVETMLGATQEQLFNTKKVAATADSYDANGNFVPGTAERTDITGFKPYQAYGGTYDAQGNQLSYDPSKAIAGFSPLQTQAQQGIAGLKASGAYDSAGNMAAAAGQGAMDSANIAYGYGAQGQQSGLMGQQLGIQGGQKYGEMGANYGAQGAGYGAQGANYGDLSAQVGQMGLQAQQTGQRIGNQAQQYARQAANAGNQYAGQATNPYAMQAYMSPYMQNVVDVQNREAQRQSGIMGTQQQAEATKAGAFGGGRDAIMRAERERNLGTLMNQNQAQGQQAAYQQAQQAQQFGANLGLQGLQGAQQGLGTALQGGQLGLSGVGTALQGLQGGMQGAGVGIQGSQAGMQGAGVGLQGVNAQLAGTAQGMQGAGVGLQGVQGAQAGYGLANQAAANQASIASQEQAAQLGILNAQNTMGAQQQAQQQQIINQSMTDYANAQQYPLMQLGTMSNMLRGLPMQAQTTNQYAAAPNAVTQGIGAAGAAASLFNATKAEGGVIKSYASGGITSYDVGGAVEADLEDMDVDGLKRQVKESSSPRIKQMAQRILAEKQMPARRMAGGGIIAFAKGDQVEDEFDGIQMADATQARDPRVVSDAEPLPNEGIMMASAAPRTAPKVVNPAGGLLGNATSGALPNAAPTPTPTDAFANAQKDQAAHQATANKSIETVMAERQALRDKLGVGTDAPREAYRAEQMAERANLKDEAERRKNLRLAEFFASWGSTPGPVLVAGMNALKKTIPGIVEDDKEAKRLKRESDKVIFDIDQATRLEKLGRVDEATAIIEKAATHAQQINKDLLTAQTQRYGYDKQLEGTKITANRMAAAHENSANRSDLRNLETQRYNFQRTEQEAKKAVAALEAQIAKEAKDNTAYTTAKRIADSNVRGTDKTLKANAIKTVQEAEAGWKTRRDAANSDLIFARDQLSEINKNMGIGVKKNDNSGKDGAPNNRPSLDSFQRP